MFRQKWKLNKQKWKDYIDFVNYNTTVIAIYDSTKIRISY